MTRLSASSSNAPADSQLREAAIPSSVRNATPRGHGPYVVSGTVLARKMAPRRLKKHHVAAALRVSDRALYNYMTRRRPIPVLKVGILCDLLDMDQEELVDEQGFLRRA